MTRLPKSEFSVQYSDSLTPTTIRRCVGLNIQATNTLLKRIFNRLPFTSFAPLGKTAPVLKVADSAVSKLVFGNEVEFRKTKKVSSGA